MVAVNVVCWPNTEGCRLVVTVTVVSGLLTAWVTTGDVLPR